MGQRGLHPGPKSYEAEWVVIAGTFLTDGSGDPIAASHNITGASAVTKTGTGVYKVALRDNFAGDLMFADAQVSDGSLLLMGITDDVDAASPYVELTFKDADTPAATNIVSLTCYVYILVARR